MYATGCNMCEVTCLGAAPGEAVCTDGTSDTASVETCLIKVVGEDGAFTATIGDDVEVSVVPAGYSSMADDVSMSWGSVESHCTN